MSRHDTDPTLHQMLDHAREAMILSKDKSPAELIDDRVLSLAIVRLMEIVGEAANRVPKEKWEGHPPSELQCTPQFAFDIRKGFLPGLSLDDASRRAWDFRYPVAISPGVNSNFRPAPLISAFTCSCP